MEKLTLKSMKLYFEGIPELETERLILTLFSRNDMVPYLRYNEDGTSLLSRVYQEMLPRLPLRYIYKNKGVMFRA